MLGLHLAADKDEQDVVLASLDDHITKLEANLATLNQTVQITAEHADVASIAAGWQLLKAENQSVITPVLAGDQAAAHAAFAHWRDVRADPDGKLDDMVDLEHGLADEAVAAMDITNGRIRLGTLIVGSIGVVLGWALPCTWRAASVARQVRSPARLATSPVWTCQRSTRPSRRWRMAT